MRTAQYLMYGALAGANVTVFMVLLGYQLPLVRLLAVIGAVITVGLAMGSLMLRHLVEMREALEPPREAAWVGDDLAELDKL